MGSLGEDDENFDLIQPSLIQQVKKILDQYPDDGQILKELIQNAEDAEASEVKILFDQHSYGKSRLFTPQLAKFQGPALYAYNNAKFSLEDWKGIRLLCDSIKVKDPMKVGRFGLGFKSVFHMTDLPSVISDNRLLVIDPHEKYLNDEQRRRTGKSWHLRTDAHKINQIPDQFAPYKGIFNCTEESFTSGTFNGTIFRFPLRDEASELSELLYSSTKIQGLFDCFQREAPLTLLFMKNLESIELFERGAHETEPRKVFQVKIADSSLEKVRDHRRHFKEQVQKLRASSADSVVDPVKVTYPMTIQTICNQGTGGGDVRDHAFIVTQYYSGNQVSVELKSLIADEALSYMPWVGVALPLTPKPQGHLFCFLPLPLEAKSLTGLPVHVNGFFALSQNRRHLKWPSADLEESGQPITDKSLLWNRCLLQEVLPKAYAELLLKLVKLSQSKIKLLDATKYVWPDRRQVDPKWKIVLAPFFKKILSRKVFHSKVGGGKWLQLNEVIFDRLDTSDSTTQAVVKAMLMADQNVVTVPPHISDAIKTFSTNSVQELSPLLVRGILQPNPKCYTNLSRNEKLSLLKFVLRGSSYADLQGLCLLPLANKTFVEFGNGYFTSEVYVCSSEHPQTLLPGLDDRFIDMELEAGILQEMRKIATSGHTQVRHLDKEAVAQLIPRVLPGNGLLYGQLMCDWFKQLWTYLGRHFKDLQALNRFQGKLLIPTTPVTTSLLIRLTSLEQPSSCIVRCRKGAQLSEGVVRMLRGFGLTVLEELPECISNHPSVVPYFVKPPDAQGVMEALEQYFSGTSQISNPTEVSLDDAQSLREVLSKAQISVRQRQILQTLPLFKTLEVPGLPQCKVVSLQQVTEGLKSNDLPPFPLSRQLIDLRDGCSYMLAQVLGITILHPMDLVDGLLQRVTEKKLVGSDIDSLMKYIFERLPRYSNQAKLRERLNNIPFVPVSGGKRKMPKELFDPQDSSLRRIFDGEGDRFPSGSWYVQPSILSELRQLGLKQENKVTADDILHSVRVIRSMDDASRGRLKSIAVFTYINNHPQVLGHLVSSGGFFSEQLGHSIKNIPWVPVLRTKPPTYPSQLALHTEYIFFEKPTNLKGPQFIAVVGTTKPIVDTSVSSCTSVMNWFGWNVDPSLEDVLTHLSNAINGYDVCEKAAFLWLIKEVYKFLERVGSVEAITSGLYSLGISKWVWNGDGFSSPEDVVLEKPFMDLTPYVCPLPVETREHRQLFYDCGMKTECDDSSLLDVMSKIRDKHENEPCSKYEIRRDLQMAVDIICQLKPDPGEVLDEEIYRRLLLPLHSDGDDTLMFAPIEECTYCDLEWLKQGYDESDVDDEEDVKIRFIHRNIPITTADDLQVPTLMSRMLEVEGLDFGESFGQSEPLTRRLNRLLDEYTDGFSVPKELIQNADDAGATEVRFLYDERTNDDAKTCLIDDGMKGCQGPALWTYNDAIFSEADFQNITKLNGATKEDDAGKIGRFGLGFNAVYNLTDVPSFVSRNNIVMFDPHTTHLGRAIRDKSKPGIKIDLTKPKKLRRLANQFKPYNGIFGCDLSPSSDQTTFDGTLFRFPLRTKEQAVRSEIKGLHYDKSQVVELLRMLVRGAESLLLFTQNVCKVSVFHLPKDSSSTMQPVELVSITKSGVRVLRELQVDVPLSEPVRALPSEQQTFIRQCNILKASSEVMKRVGMNTGSTTKKILESSIVVRMDSRISEEGRKLLDADTHKMQSQECHWMVTSNMVGGPAMEFSKRNGSLIPTAGVAARLRRMEDGTFVPIPVKKDHQSRSLFAHEEQNGRIFCFLPLPIHSGLPVHINGSFATDSSRRHLREKTEDDKSDFGARWNTILIEGAVCQAYLTLLGDLKVLLPSHKHSYDFHSLWPKTGDVKSSCEALLKQFYKAISLVPEVIPPALFSDGRSWSDVTRIAFLHPDLRNDERIGDTALAVFRMLRDGEDVVIDMPRDIFQSFEESGCMPVIQSHCYDRLRVYNEIFLPAIQDSQIPRESSDKLVLYALDDEAGTSGHGLASLLAGYRCIPASPDGETLKYPKELLHPHDKAATLFRDTDGRFPFGQEYATSPRPHTLTLLGMRRNDLEWCEVIERAKSVETLNARKTPEAYKEALQRTRAVLTFIDHKLENNSKGAHSVAEEIQSIKFLPYVKKAKGIPFKWRSDAFEATALLAANDLYPPEHRKLVSATSPLLDDSNSACGTLAPKVKSLLDMNKSVTLEQVKSQMETVIEVNLQGQNADAVKEVQKVCDAMYVYFQKQLEKHTQDIKEFLFPLKFILQGTCFLSADQVAFRHSDDLSPYLHALQKYYVQKFHELFSALEVKESFGLQDYVSLLERVKSQYQMTQVDEKTLQVTVLVAHRLAADQNLTQVPIYLPDSKGIMRQAKELSIKDCIWMADEEGIDYANNGIRPWDCIHLGVNTRRQETLRKHALGIPFGQKEQLTTRLKRILTGYPCGNAILKELLQNADDAQATKMCFIKDPRHHPKEKVFEKSWEPLQGPALCVYNNSPFTQKDIAGIQRLGEGSKADDPNKTGQYGVGFNAVYHLTDAPSFISKGDEIGESMCVFDPHFKFVPGASKEEPGMMYSDLTKLKGIFSDVFPCYLEEHFPIDNATMFRFPLRDECMARESLISTKPIAVDKLDSLMKDFKGEIFDTLLFVNNVTEIVLCEIDKTTGKPCLEYKVKATLTDEDKRKREEFGAYVKEVATKMSEGGLCLKQVPKKEVSYVVHLQDNEGKMQKWLVVQRVGFDEDVDTIPDCVTKAVQKKELGLLPRGGVATLIDSSEPSKIPGKGFCFLPLPFTTGLPVHVNGHFALDHEARRSLWHDENNSGYRGSWNNMLLRLVVAPCYVTLLDEVRQHMKNQVLLDPESVCKRSEAESLIGEYLKLFPSLVNEEQYWNTMAQEVYRRIDRYKVGLLPLVRPVTDGGSGQKSEKQNESVSIEWFAPTGKGKERAYFNDLATTQRRTHPTKDTDAKDKKETESLSKSAATSSHTPSGLSPYRGVAHLGSRVNVPSDISRYEGCLFHGEDAKKLTETLLSVAFNLLDVPLEIFENFKNSSVEVSCVTPGDVVAFFGTFGKEEQLCRLGELPAPVKSTPFKDVSNLLLVLKYCKKEETFLNNLHGLPLLLTQDEVLRTFDNANPVFLTPHLGITPKSTSQFVHRSLYNDVFHIAENQGQYHVFKHFDITAFANLLPDNLKPEFQSSDQYVTWVPDDGKKLDIPSNRWLHNVWRFFMANVKNKLKEYEAKRSKELSGQRHRNYVEEGREDKKMKSHLVRQALSPVKNWCLLPATVSSSGAKVKTEHYLVPLVMAETVLEGLCANESFVEVVRKLSLPQLNWIVIDGSNYSLSNYSDSSPSKIARMVVAAFDNPKSVLATLSQKLQVQSLTNILKWTESIILLQYFSGNVSVLSEAESTVLRKLPFYPTLHGECISIHAKYAYVLPSKVPKDDMHIWEETSGIVFLQEYSSLEDLYNFLGCSSKTTADIYCDIIFPRFHEMRDAARLAHLEFLRETLKQLPRKKEYDPETEKLLAAMRCLKFIPDEDGVLRTASTLYDPSNPVFKVMLDGRKSVFPSKPFSEHDWLGFLRPIGLVSTVSTDKFIEYAGEVEEEARARESAATKKKSKVLVDHLFKRKNVATDSLLGNVKHIKFIAPHEVRQDLVQLYPQYGSTQDGKLSYVSFEGSLVQGHDMVSWTCMKILSEENDPSKQGYYCFTRDYHEDHHLNNLSNYKATIMTELGIHKEPPIEKVVSHCLTICRHLSKELADAKGYDKHTRTTLTDVMEAIYTFLSKKPRNNPCVIMDTLKNCLCVVVEEGKRLILPRQTVAEFLEVQEIRPYLYKVPPEIAKFLPLFERLGGTKTVTATQYAQVLESIHQECGDSKLEPNETKKAFQATKGLFEQLAKEKENGSSELTQLYLPGVKRSSSEGAANKVFLGPSNQLICDNAPHFRDRISCFEPLLLVRLQECALEASNEDELVNKLPQTLRPKMLTDVVCEELVHDSAEQADEGHVDTAGTLKRLLTSLQFSLGFTRLVKHENHVQHRDTNENLLTTVKEKLSCLRVHSVTDLRTHLMYKGSVVANSEEQVNCFEQRRDEGGSEAWTIYIQQGQDVRFIASRVAQVVNRITGHLLGESLVHLSSMLQLLPEQVNSFLDGNQIREDSSSVASSSLPQPGSFIHIVDHHLLMNSFEVFEPGEYVGYEVDDPSLRNEDDPPTYVYAIVMEEVVEEGTPRSITTKKYKINIGNDREPIVVDGIDLYKFRRVKGSPTWELVRYEGDESHAEAAKPKNLQETMEEITRILEEAWKLPEDKRTKIIKRLFLKWHPDKNPGQEEFCTKIFQFIQNEIERLEGKKPLSGTSTGGSYGSYSNFYHRWGRRAHREQQSSRSSSWTGSSTGGYRANPQPGEARRWFRQAEADLGAVPNDIGVLSPAYEWACFKCHQAVEKALKAAQYTKDVDKLHVHDLHRIARELGDDTLSNLTAQLEGLVGISTRMRYPDCVSFPRIPRDEYSASQAQSAYQLAKQILDRVRDRFMR